MSQFTLRSVLRWLLTAERSKGWSGMFGQVRVLYTTYRWWKKYARGPIYTLAS